MMDKKNLMQKIYETGFALDDIILYLDTHPDDLNALKYYEEMQKNYKAFWKEYNRQVAPLTAQTVPVSCDCNSSLQSFAWNQGPMPWEGGF